jgi:hypothetical protein
VIVRGTIENSDAGYWTLGDRFVSLQGQFRLAFSFLHSYNLSRTGEHGSGWHVSSRNYFYQVHDQPGLELIAFHWHPGRPGQPAFPHLHIAGSDGSVAIGRTNHVPTGRVSLESVVRFLITELDVRPLRVDWERVLDEGERTFMSRRTW